jgi:acyl dehydratase
MLTSARDVAGLGARKLEVGRVTFRVKIEDLPASVGTALGPTGWLQVTQDDVDAFAEVTGDKQWIHVDPERAAVGPFGTTIVHGYLTLSLIVPLLHELIRIEDVRMGLNYGLNRVRFPSPVPVGSRIRATGHIQSVDRVGDDGYESVLVITIEIEQASKPACVAEMVVRHYAA